MNPFARHISIALTAWLALASAPAWASPPARKPCDAARTTPTLPDDIRQKARLFSPYPTFCAIPNAPTNLPTAADYRRKVIDIRLDGRRLAELAAPDTFTLADTEAFAAGLRQAASPPPPMTAPDEPDTAAFVKAMREQATPPKPRH